VAAAKSTLTTNRSDAGTMDEIVFPFPLVAPKNETQRARFL